MRDLARLEHPLASVGEAARVIAGVRCSHSVALGRRLGAHAVQRAPTTFVRACSCRACYQFAATSDQRLALRELLPLIKV